MIQTLEERQAQLQAEEEEFASVAGHDLKAPLRAMLNLSQWIEEDLGPGASAEARENLSLLKKRAGRMSQLLESLLEYARAGRPAPAPQRCELGPLLGGIAEELKTAGGVKVEIAAGMPSVVLSVAPFRQLLHHLVANAVKHHDKPAGLVQVSARESGDVVEVTVKDDGPGIDPRFHETIFRLGQTLRPKDEMEGGGVGLAVVKKIASRYGAAIRLESAPGKGSAFTLSWPKGR